MYICHHITFALILQPNLKYSKNSSPKRHLNRLFSAKKIIDCEKIEQNPASQRSCRGEALTASIFRRARRLAGKSGAETRRGGKDPRSRRHYQDTGNNTKRRGTQFQSYFNKGCSAGRARERFGTCRFEMGVHVYSKKREEIRVSTRAILRLRFYETGISRF